MKSDIVAIVVTYNRKELLRECIEAILESEIVPDILVVDNNSTDGTKESVSDYISSKKIMYYNTGKNIGGAGGFNYGLKTAYKLGYKYFWLMDDDTIVTKNALTVFLDYEKTHGSNYGFLSSYATWMDGNSCKMNYHTVSTDWNEEKELITKGVVKITAATFVSFFTRREVVKRVGLPIKEYFIWGDDSEYTNRISKIYPCYFLSNSVVVHKMKTNIGTYNFEDVEDIDRINRQFYSVRNDICSAKRKSLKELFKYLLYLFKEFLKVLIKPNKYKLKKLGVLCKGFFAGIIFFPRIEKV